MKNVPDEYDLAFVNYKLIWPRIMINNIHVL
jgi:hypothetical protein